MKKTEWLEVSVSPVHFGFYQVKAEHGALQYLEYTATGWSDAGYPFTLWRGQKVELKESAVQKHRARIAKHSQSRSAAGKAAASALRLARHMVATGQDAYTRCLHYQIALTLNAALDDADHFQSDAARKELSADVWRKVLAKVAELELRESLSR